MPDGNATLIVGGVEYDIPPTQKAIRLLDKTGAEVAYVTGGGHLVVTDATVLDGITITGDLAVGGALTVTGAATFNGDVVMPALPTADPSVEGQLWSNSNVVTVSAGA